MVETTRAFAPAAGRLRSSEAAQAQRHVAEFERRVERQRWLIERLERDQHFDMLEQAKRVLVTLEETLRHARDHLEIEIKFHGN